MTYRLKNIRTGEIESAIYWTYQAAKYNARQYHVIVDQYGRLVLKPAVRFRVFHRRYK